jgi:hypothetical protein
MAIKPVCNFCKNELIEFGALLFSPPDKKDFVKKYHLCKNCYEKIVKEHVKS